MTKIVIGTDEFHGTNLDILNRDFLVRLFQSDCSKYFDELDISEYRTFESDSKYLDFMFCTDGGCLTYDSRCYVLRYDDSVRSDSFFVYLVESLGVDQLETGYGGMHLKVVEIPDDVEWYCYYPDVGPMCVCEKARVWY